jgi:hypothetical protein
VHSFPVCITSTSILASLRCTCFVIARQILSTPCRHSGQTPHRPRRTLRPTDRNTHQPPPLTRRSFTLRSSALLHPTAPFTVHGCQPSSVHHQVGITRPLTSTIRLFSSENLLPHPNLCFTHPNTVNTYHHRAMHRHSYRTSDFLHHRHHTHPRRITKIGISLFVDPKHTSHVYYFILFHNKSYSCRF